MKGIRAWKRFGILTLLGLLLSVAIACRPIASSSTSPELEFWTMQLKPQFTNYFEPLIARFEKENPGVKVRWVDVPWEAMPSKILTAVSAKTAPDVVNLNPDFATQLASRNAWLELDGRVSEAVRQQYLPNIWNDNTLNNKSFGIPWYLTSRVTVYNQDLLQKAGVSQPPSTYEELSQVAKQVKEKTGKYAFFITVVPDDSLELLESLVQMGVELVDAEGKAAFNSPQGKAAFQYWVDFYQQGLMPKEALTQGHRRAIELYQAGELAFLSSGAEFMDAIAKNAPSIAKVSATASQITGQTGKKSVAVMNMVVPRDTDKPDAALKFALFVTNTPNQLAFAKAAKVLPSTQEALAEYRKSLTSEGDTSPLDKAIDVSASQMQEAQVLIPPMKNLNQLQQAIYENLQAAMLEKKSVEQALTDAAQEWNRQVS
jgi:putative chitobiose transport system substrate-binding protein